MKLLDFTYEALMAEEDLSGDGYSYGSDGKRYWGKYGAAGVLLRHRDGLGVVRFFLARRSKKVGGGRSWSIPGGAVNKYEHSLDGALREMEEEIGRRPDEYRIIAAHVHEPVPEWRYVTWALEVPYPFRFMMSNWETDEAGWFTIDEMREMNLYHPFRDAFFSHDGWHDLRDR